MSKLKAQVVGIFTLMAVVIACMGLMAYVPVHADPGQDWSWLQEQFKNASTDSTAPSVITLTNDITASATDGPLTIPEGTYVTLDLNGHTIDRGLYNSTMTNEEIYENSREDGSVIVVYGDFTLTDSSDNESTPEYDGTGLITGGNSYNGGGGVSVESIFGCFTMKKGTISRNYGYDGGGVYSLNSFFMEGGTISENCSELGAVYSYIVLSGNPKITGNTTTGNKKGNIYPDNLYASIEVAGPLTNGAEIDITDFYDYIYDVWFREDFAEGYYDYTLTASDVSHFIYDGDKVAVLNNDGKATLIDISGWAWLQIQFDNANTDSTAPTVITLTNSITASEDDDPLTIPEGKYVVLDLNGWTIDRGLYNSTMTATEISEKARENGSVIVVNGDFTLTDSSDDGTGLITGGNDLGEANGGGGICVNNRFTMEKGTISGNYANYGGGVYGYTGCTFIMNGGTISGNIADANCGGILLAEESIFVLYGNAKITDNKLYDSVDGGDYYWSDDIRLFSSSLSSAETIKVAGPLTEGAEIGITEYDGYGNGVFAEGYNGYELTSNDVSHFVCVDDEDKVAALNDDGKAIFVDKLTWDGLQARLDDASGDAEAPTEIRLVNDITALGNQPLTISEGKYVILDLNGHTLDRGLYNSGMTDEEILAKSDDDGCVIKVLGNLTLTDSSDKETGKITGGNGINIGGGVWVKGSFTMKKGTISGNRSTDVGGGVYVDVSGSFTMKKGTISGNCATDGGGVYINANGTFIMEGGTISENKAEADGAGVYVNDNGTFTMEGGAISKNSAKQEGGGVYVCMDGTFTMEGGTIGENKAENEGTEVYGSNGSTFAVLGSAKINGNNSDDSTPNISFQTVYQNIVVGGPLTGDAEISFTGYRRYVNAIFAKGSNDYTLTSDDISHFTCEDERLNAALDDNGCLIFLSDWGILQQKFNNADGDSTAPTVIKLDKDIVALASDGALTIPTGKYVTLDLNGHTLDRGLYKSNMTAEEIIAKQDEDGSVIKVLGTLTLIDSSDDVSTSEYDGTGKITGGNQSASGGGIDIKKNAAFTMKGGTISGNYAKSAGGGVLVRSNGTFTMEGGTISGDYAKDFGGGVFVAMNGSLELSGNFAIAENKMQAGDGLINNDIYTSSQIRITGQLTCANQMVVGFSGVGVGFVGEGYELTSADIEKFNLYGDDYVLIFDETDKKGYFYYNFKKIEIGDIPDQTYSGSEIKPVMSVEMTYEDEVVDFCNFIDDNGNYVYFDLSYADNTAAGTATVTITGKNGFGGTIEKTFKINPKPVTVSLEASDKVYDGSTNATLKGTPVISGLVEGDLVSVSGGTATFSDKNVGTGKSVVFSGYSLTGVDAGNYSLTSQPANVTANITKADATVKALSAAKSLGEADPTLEATVTGVASGETINYTLARAEGENVGEYDITVTLGENPNYNVTVENAKFTISEVIAKVITAPTANTFAYDGKEHELVTAGVADTAMEYSLDGTTFTSEIPKKKDAGTYRVYFRAAADGNHTVGTIGNVEASITRVNATVTAINTGKVINETDPLLTANVTGLIGTDSVNYTVTRESGEELGSYAITVTGDAVQGNYNVTYVNGTFTIAINKITPSVTLGYETIVYDGTEKKPAVTVTSNGTELSADDYTVSYSNNTNAGTATVTVSAKEGSDYTFEAVSVNFVITKASAPANVPATVMNVASDCEKLSDVALITDWSWENGETALIEGEKVSAKAVYSGTDASNFETVSVTIEVTRAKKVHVHTIDTEKLNETKPSCTEKGSYVLRKFCTDCNETISSETITVDATGHTFVNGVCSSCGAKENADNNEQGNGSGNEQNNGSGNEQNNGSGNEQNNGSGNEQNNGSGDEQNNGSGNEQNNGSGNEQNNGSENEQNNGSGNEQGSSSDTQQTNNNSTQQNNNQQQGSGSSSQQTNNNSNTQQSNNQQQGSGYGSQQGSGSDNKPSGSKDPAPVVTQNADGTATKTETKETKDGTKETVATTTDANGKIIQIVTERVSTDEKGNETKKVTTVNPDGTSNSEQTLTNASGKVIETVKESVKTDVQGTQTDKSVTEKISGTIIESTMITFPSGSSKTNTVEKQKDGTVTTTDISQKKNGSYTSEQTVNNVDGSSVTENAKVNAKGNLTSYSKETVASSGAKTTTHYYVKQQVKVSGGVIKAGKMHLGKVITNATKYKVSKYAKVNGKKYYITAITAKSFKNCKNLKKITLGKKITSIEHGTFDSLSEDAKIVIKVDKKGTFLRIKRLVIAAGFTNEDNIIWSKK